MPPRLDFLSYPEFPLGGSEWVLEKSVSHLVYLSLPAAAWFLRGETGNPVFNFLDSPISYLQPIATQLGKYRRGMTKITTHSDIP